MDIFENPNMNQQANDVELDEELLANQRPMSEYQPSQREVNEEQVLEIDFNDSKLEIPSCIFCDNPYSIKDGRTPYVMPCQQHTCCKQCLKIARENRLTTLACPVDKIQIDIDNLKSLLKHVEIQQFIE